jgi:type IV pilus assembly protein PilA
MLLNRLIRQSSQKICRIYNHDHWQIELKFREKECSGKHLRKQIFYNSTFCLLPFAFFLAVTPITLPVFFAVAKAQWPPTLKSQESAAKQYVAAMNKAQQAYYANNTGFTSSVSNLGLDIKPDTSNYKYSINTANKAVFNYAVSNQAHLKSFVGGIFLVGNKPQTILCLNAAPGKIKPPNPMNVNGVLECAASTGKIAQ